MQLIRKLPTKAPMFRLLKNVLRSGNSTQGNAAITNAASTITITSSAATATAGFSAAATSCCSASWRRLFGAREQRAFLLLSANEKAPFGTHFYAYLCSEKLKNGFHL